jgi:hypothetical protein
MKLHSPATGTLQAATVLILNTYTTIGAVIAGAARDQIVFLLVYTKGDETSVEFKVQFSDTFAFTTAYDEMIVESASGVSTIKARTFTLVGTSNIILPVASLGLFCRLQAKATGGTPTGTLAATYRIDVINK